MRKGEYCDDEGFRRWQHDDGDVHVYTEITELTAEILHTFIQRIEIGARAEKKARYTTQEIRIIYRDIGILDDIPETLDGIELYEQKTTVA